MKRYKCTTISSKIDYQNPYMQILKDKIRLPDGKSKDYYVLNREGPFSIIIPRTSARNTFLVGQYRYPVKFYSWEFPMGYVEHASPLKMAKAELYQETGIQAKNYRLLGKFFVASGHSSQKAYVYLATGLTYHKPHPEIHEFIKIKKVSFSQIDKLVTQKKILDGPTLSALYLYYQSSKT